MYLTLQRRTGPWLCLKKKIVRIEKMLLLRRRNTTSLKKFHPLTLHTSPNYLELTKHHTCEATIVKNQYTEIMEEKASLISAKSFL
jgi:hypothetical protein